VYPRYHTADGLSWSSNIDNAKQMRSQPTEAEYILWQFLRAKKTGYKFKRQHLVLGYIPDFICLEQKLIVEIDGGYHNDVEPANTIRRRANKVFKRERI
jgi:very-short-patch-repair endonuclease